MNIFLLCKAVAIIGVAVVAAGSSTTFDVAIYGATPAGIAAAVAASRTMQTHGRTANVVLLDPHARPGGMMAGGIGFDDVDTALLSAAGLSHPSDVPPEVYGASLYTEKTEAVLAHYEQLGPAAATLSKHGTHHEPHVAEEVLRKLLFDANVTLLLNHTLIGVGVAGGASLGRTGAGINATVRIVNASFETDVEHNDNDSGDNDVVVTTATIAAPVWVDGTYEGDLVSAAGAPVRQGRESRAEFGELNAGVVLQDFSAHRFQRGSTGEESPRLPAMTWRLCFSTNSSNRVPLTAPPAGYNSTRSVCTRACTYARTHARSHARTPARRTSKVANHPRS